MRFFAAMTLALLVGCSRDLEVPNTSPLAIAPAFASVAPREGLTLSASGGAQGYKFAFAKGGKLSGGDASIDASSGAYQSGAQGSAHDIVEVSDSSGALAPARITV